MGATLLGTSCFSSLSRALCFCSFKILVLVFSLLDKAVFCMVIVSGTVAYRGIINRIISLKSSSEPSIEAQVTTDLVYCLFVERPPLAPL